MAFGPRVFLTRVLSGRLRITCFATLGGFVSGRLVYPVCYMLTIIVCFSALRLRPGKHGR